MSLEHQPAFLGAVLPLPFRPLCLFFHRSNRRAFRSANVFPSLLCFHTLTNSFSRSCFPLTLLQIAGGCHPQLANSSPANRPETPIRPCPHTRTGSRLEPRACP